MLSPAAFISHTTAWWLSGRIGKTAVLPLANVLSDAIVRFHELLWQSFILAIDFGAPLHSGVGFEFTSVSSLDQPTRKSGFFNFEEIKKTE